MPSIGGFILNHQDVRTLEQVVRQVRSNTATIRRIEEDDKTRHADHQLADIYIARTPPEGITGLSFTGTGTVLGTEGTGTSEGTGTGTVYGTGTYECRAGDTPGYADDCKFYRVNFSSGLIECYNTLSRRLYNLSTCNIEGDKYVLAIKTKHGTYIALDVFDDDCLDDGTGTGTGTAEPAINGAGWLVGLCVDDCLELTIRSATGLCSGIDTTQSIILTSTDGVYWDGETNLVHCQGESAVTLTLAQGIPTLTVGQYYAVLDSAGLDDGEYYIDFAIFQGVCNPCDGTGTGTGSGTSSCGDQLACGRNALVMRIKCVPCATEDGTGTDTGTGTGDVPLTEVACCTDDVPQTLYARITGDVTQGPIPLVWAGAAFGYWDANFTLSGCGDIIMRLTPCSGIGGDEWILEISGDCQGTGIIFKGILSECRPIDDDYSIGLTGVGCSCSGSNITVSVTET